MKEYTYRGYKLRKVKILKPNFLGHDISGIWNDGEDGNKEKHGKFYLNDPEIREVYKPFVDFADLPKNTFKISGRLKKTKRITPFNKTRT